MGRVERRMYRRKKKRVRLLHAALLMLLLGMAVIIAWKRLPDHFLAERLGRMNAASDSAGTEDRVETRDVTLAEDQWYAIQTGVFSTEEAACQKADAYAERGAPGTVIREGEKWRVFIACYPTENEAASVRERLENKQKVDTYLYVWKCPELRLRLTGKVSQLDAVEAGFTLLLSTAAALRDTATALDAAQLTTPEVHSLLSSLDEQINLWESTLKSSFGRSLPAIAEQMLEITGRWDTRYEALKKAEGATVISAALKAQGMGLYDDIASWRRSFAAQ